MRILPALLLAAVLPAARLAAEQASSLTIDNASFDVKAKAFTVSGKVAVADGTVVCASVLFAKVAGEQLVRGPVTGGAFKLDFEPIGEKWLLAGAYTIKAEVRAEDQGPEAQIPAGCAAEKEVQVGDAAKQAQEVETIRKQLLEFTENCRRLFLDAEEKGSYILLGIERKKKGSKDGKLSDVDMKKYMDVWQGFAGVEKYWLNSYNRIRMGYDDYHNNIYLSYYPEVEQKFRAVIETLEKWFYSYWSDICTALGQEIPKDIMGRGQFFDRASVEQSLMTSVNAIYTALQVPSVNWHPVVLWDSEDGEIVKDTYTSRTTKFEVTRPNDQWVFQILSEDPVLRLKILPPGSTAKDDVTHHFSQVEVKDFPDSTGPKDLTDFVEMSAHDRYPSYKKISGKPVSVKDENFPGGNRPGFDLIFQYESNNVKYKARSYELFCGTFKRTYAVVSVEWVNQWDSFDADADMMCKSFKVLKQVAPEGADKK